MGQNETEPNNNFVNANTISFGQLLNGAITPTGDKDYYQVQVGGPGVIVVRLRNIPAGMTYGVRIYDSIQRELTSDFGTSTDPAYANDLVCTAGTYFISVEESGNNNSNTGQYELEVSFDATDVYECNNSFEEAATINFDQTINASIFDTGDKDFYLVQAPNAGVIVARLRNIPAGMTYGIRIFDALQRELTTDFGTSADPAYADELICTSGAYYISIEESGNNNANAGQYELEVSFDATDVFECNNSFDEATPIDFAQPINASIFDTGDRDYYQFVVSNPGLLEVRLEDIPNGRTYGVKIYDATQELLNSDFGTSTDPAVAFRKICDPGTYFVLVEESGNNSSSSLPYELTLFFNDDDVYECNGNQPAAISINPCTEIRGNILPAGDLDYYELSIATAGDYTAIVRDVPSNIGIDLEIIDEFASRIAISSNAPEGASAQLNFSIAASGVYYLIVSASSTNDANPDLYTLTFAEGIPCTAVPEICNNGQDDDGDGLVDCNDPDCANFGDCENTGTDCTNVNIALVETISSETCTGNDGTVSLTPAGGTPPYAYIWSNAATGNSISGLTQGSYSVTVTDAENCSTIATFAVPQDCDNSNNCPIASFNAVDQGGGTYFFENTSTNNPLAILWDFGDGSPGTIEYSPTHTYNSDGTYEVMLIVANNCGVSELQEDTVRQSITVSLGGSNGEPTIVLGEAEGPSGSVVQVPVVALNFNIAIGSIQGILNITDSAVAQIQGVEGGVIGNNVLINPANGRFSYFNAGNSILLGASDTLFFLNILLTGNNGDMSDVTIFGNDFFPLEYTDEEFNFQTPLSQNGKVTIIDNFTIFGQVLSYWDSPMPDLDIQMQMTADNVYSEKDTLTDLNGQYQFREVPAQATSIVKPERNTEVTNGLSAAGLFLAQRFILGFDVPQINSPFQIVAGDANCDGRLSTADLFIIQKVQVGIETEFPGCPSWVFAPESERSNFQMSTLYYPNYPFPQETEFAAMSTDTVADFIGIKVGDILKRANLSGVVEDEFLDVRSNDRMVINVQHRLVDGDLEYQFLTTSSTSLASYQFSLDVDTSQLEFKGYAKAEGFGDGLLIGDHSNHLKVSWFATNGGPVRTNAGTTLMKLYFKPKAPSIDIERSLALKIDGLVPIAHDQELDGAALDLEFGSMLTNTSGLSVSSELILYPNQPNPFSTETTIRFHLPKRMQAQLSIRDINGQLVWEQQDFYEAGETATLLHLDLPAGVYTYSLYTESGVKTRLMVVQN